MLVRVLGAVGVLDGERVIEVGTPRQRELLVLLASRAGELVSEDSLIDALWPEGDPLPDNPRRSVQTYVSRLRSVVGTSGIETQPAGYVLTIDTDARRFERAVDDARRHRDRDALETALAQFAEPPFAGFTSGWLPASGERLREIHATATEELAELFLEGNEIGPAQRLLAPLVDDMPERERAVRWMMLAQYRGGLQAEALRTMQAHRTALVELGLGPGAEALDLERRIVSGDTTLDRVPTRRLGSYDLHEEIGAGAFGTIYRAVQPSVDREVAVKVVRPELANDREFVRRFEREAQTVARLEHPHIVPLHDYWRDPSGAFLVMRFLRGGSAEERLTRVGPFSLAEVAALVDQIGPALAVAHEAGVIHRDVKPANILFDEAGNAYLADFGIAVDAGRGGDLDLRSAGSPMYASPEQVRDRDATSAGDIYAFGVVLYELLAGVAPFADSESVEALLARKLTERVPSLVDTRPDLPKAVDLVLQTATAPDPARRFETMGDLVLAFRAATSATELAAASTGAAVERPRTAASQTLVSVEMEAANPYQGLAAFGEADSDRFYGRERLVEELADHLAGSRLLVVVGPSGSGKSSVVRAGLLPRLRDTGDFVASMIPGPHPFEELETALQRVAVTPTGALLDQLTADDRGLGRAVTRVLPDDEDGDLVLVVDQFEELFTQTAADRRDAFLAAVASAVNDERSRLRVICTLRADFYDRPLQHESIAELLRANTVAVPPLGGPELEEAIVEPASRVGVTVDAALVAELIADVRDQTAALPLLQYTLTELHDRRVAGQMTLDAYQRLGGIAGALATRADVLYQEQDASGRTEVRRLFTRLVTPGEGTEDTRRRVMRSELATVSSAVIDGYGAARLLTFDHDPSSREPTVDIAHEALIRQWPRLRAWLDDDRDGRRILRHLGASAEAWEASGREDGELYRGGRLDAAEVWGTDHTDDLTELESAFLAASISRRADEQRTERRRVGRLRTLLAAAAVVAVLSLIAGTVAVQQRADARDSAAEANRQRDRAQQNETAAAAAEAEAEAARASEATRRMVSDSALLATEDRELGLLVALEAYRADPRALTLGAVQRVLISAPHQWLGALGTSGPVEQIEFVDNDTLLASGPNGIALRRLSDAMATQLDASGNVSVLDVSSDGTVAALGRSDGTWETRRIDGWELLTAGTMGGVVTAITLNPTGDLVAVAEGEPRRRLIIHDSTTVTELARAGDADIEDLRFDPTSQWLAVGRGHLSSATVHDAATGEIIGEPIALGSEGVAGVEAFEWLGEDLLVAAHGRLALVEPDTGRLADGPHQTDDTFLGAGEMQRIDGGVVLRGAAGAIQLYTLGRLTSPIVDPQLGSSLDLALAPDESTVASLESGGTIQLYDLEGKGVLRTGFLPGNILAVEMTEDASTITTWGLPVPGAYIYDGNRVSEPQFLPDLGKSLESDGAFLFLGFDPDTGAGINAYMRDGEPVRMDTEFLGANIAAIDGDTIVVQGTLGDDPQLMARVVNGRTGEVIADLDEVIAHLEAQPPATGFVTDIEFTPDGSQVVVAVRSGTVFVYDSRSWELARSPLPPEDGFHVIEFTSTGEALTQTLFDDDSLIALRDAETFERLAGPASAPRVFGFGGQSLDILEGDRYAALGGNPGGAYLWSIEEMELVGAMFPHETDFRQPAIATEAKVMATTVPGGAALWNIDPDTWSTIACDAAGRNMTEQEWQQFGPEELPHRPTCPDHPMRL